MSPSSASPSHAPLTYALSAYVVLCVSSIGMLMEGRWGWTRLLALDAARLALGGVALVAALTDAEIGAGLQFKPGERSPHADERTEVAQWWVRAGSMSRGRSSPARYRLLTPLRLSCVLLCLCSPFSVVSVVSSKLLLLLTCSAGVCRSASAGAELQAAATASKQKQKQATIASS